MKFPLARALLLLAVGGLVRAEVTRLEITQRVDVGTTGYEKIVGTLHFAVDPKHPRNRVIADLDKAPLGRDGRVEFSSDVFILRPKDSRQANGAALLEVVNRGRKGLSGFNRGGINDPVTDADIGDGFLIRQGFTLVSVGWEFDVPRAAGLMRIDVPVATEGGRPIRGVVHTAFVLDAPANEYTVSDLAAYAPVAPDGPETRLTIKASATDTVGVEIPRTRWRLKGHTLSLEGGFEPGKTYEVFYEAVNPPIAGLGFAAIRDTAAWLKHPSAGLAPVRFVHAFGSSQSGRFLRGFLYEGFATDERDQPVLDGVMAHIAGSARLDLNRRWSLPRALGTYSATAFPFSDMAQRDAVSGASEGLLENPRSLHRPKVFYTNTAVEYWGGGRVAALGHTDPAGNNDVALPENVRSYFFTGAQHGPGRFPPPAASVGQQRANPADYWYFLRALLGAMQRWVADGTPPPASAYPTFRDATLTKAAAVALPATPGLASPRALQAGVRTANPFISGGGGAGTPLPLLIPQVDEDGNERAGVRLPEVAVPLATYTGWNLRSAKSGAPNDLVPLVGSWIPFPATRAAREASGDPRRSVEERYASRADYLKKFKEAADALVKGGYLLPGDVARVVQRGGEQWDFVMSLDGAKTASGKN